MKHFYLILFFTSCQIIFSQGNGNGNGNGVGNNNATPWTKNSTNDIYYNEGKVGVGTDNPTELLEVQGNTLVNGNVLSTDKIGIGTINPISDLHIQKTSGKLYNLIQSGSNFLGIGVNDQMQFGPSLVFNENSQLRFGRASSITESGATDFQEFMRIDNSGKIGIGTINPISDLHLLKTSGTIYNLIQSGSNFIGIGLNDQMQYGPSLVFNENSQLRIGKASAMTNTGASNFNEFVRIDNRGNFGIGTSSPSAKLEVIGSTLIDGQLTAQDGVFEGRTIRLGNEWSPTKRNFEFNINETGDYMESVVFDNNGTKRQWVAFDDNKTNVGYIDGNQQEIFKINEGDLGEDNVFMHLPKKNSRIVIGGYGGYLVDQQYKFVVKEGQALIEDDLTTRANIYSDKTAYFNTTGAEKFYLRLGVNLGSISEGRRNFDWYRGDDGDNGVYHNIADNNRKIRSYNHFYDDKTAISYNSHTGDNILKFAHNESGDDVAYMHLPRPNTRIVVGGYGDYLLNQGHKFVIKDGTAMIENAIFTNGRIAIGTTEDDPGYALTVKGKAHVQEVRVDLMGAIAPDYVFYEGYKLRTLEEVEEYINDNGHLPNIPSAKTMEKEGIDLKEMNLKLLEKIEELTLYMIDQKKALDNQKNANRLLLQRIQKVEEALTKNGK